MVLPEAEEMVFDDGEYDVVLFDIINSESESAFMVRVIGGISDGLELHFFVDNKNDSSDKKEILSAISSFYGLKELPVYPYNELLKSRFRIIVKNGEIIKIKGRILDDK